MAAGVRSLLAPWLGGAGISGTTASVRGLLAPWIGGVSASSTIAGYRGLLAFWVGGLATVPISAPSQGWRHPISQERKREIRRQNKIVVEREVVNDMLDLQDIAEMLVLWRQR